MPSLVTHLPRHRTPYVIPRSSRRVYPGENSRTSNLVILACLVAPFAMVMLWGSDLHTTVARVGNREKWSHRATLTDFRASRLYAIGSDKINISNQRDRYDGEEIRDADGEGVQALMVGTEREGEREAPNFINTDDVERGPGLTNGAMNYGDGVLERAERDLKTVFVPEDLNDPTKVARPVNGFPPRVLPRGHRNGKLLERIRKLSEMRPRWAKHPGMHVRELRSYGPAFSSIIISEKLKVIYVPVFKVGTTSMMWHIAYLENNRYVLDNLARDPAQGDFYLHEMGGPGWKNSSVFKKSEAEIRRCFEDPEYLKFGFVRNPFDRVISAYLDKVVQFDKGRKEYQRQMYSLYGNDVEMRRLRNESKPSFREYLEAIEAVVSQPRTNSKDLWSKDAYEDNASRRDLHWRPQVELLHPDLIHFDFVGRFERLQEDREVVLEWMYRHTDRRMARGGGKKLHATDPEDKKKLFDELREDAELRQLVLRIYKEDFERFQFRKEVPVTENAD